jgi:ubiquinone/menaquinone biosynthesis C-methylase UbiE
MILDIPKILAKFLHFSFDLLYHQLAWGYDLVAWLVSFGRWQSWILAALDRLDLTEGGRVLELGFGPGHLQFEMRRRGITCLGIDESRQMCRIARRRLNKTEAGIARGLAGRLPLANESFDAVVATFPAEYIFDQQFLEDTRRVLRGRGKILFLMGVEPGGISLVDRLLRFLYRITDQDFQSRLGPVEYLGRISALGFEVRTEAVEFNKDKLWMILGHKV